MIGYKTADAARARCRIYTTNAPRAVKLNDGSWATRGDDYICPDGSRSFHAYGKRGRRLAIQATGDEGVYRVL